MQLLTAHIEDRLKEKKWCTVFEKDLSRVFPMINTERQERYERIHAYARKHGWIASIRDPGIRVTFRKPNGEPAGRGVVHAA